MAIMKRLYNLHEVRELMSYFGDMVGWDAVMELCNQALRDPSKNFFVISKGANLKVVDQSTLLEHIVQQWQVELDTTTLLDNGIQLKPRE